MKTGAPSARFLFKDNVIASPVKRGDVCPQGKQSPN